MSEQQLLSALLQINGIIKTSIFRAKAQLQTNIFNPQTEEIIRWLP
ncbi:MAG: hypothetical protein AB4080_19350 [Trichodesmium sp.]